MHFACASRRRKNHFRHITVCYYLAMLIIYHFLFTLPSEITSLSIPLRVTCISCQNQAHRKCSLIFSRISNYILHLRLRTAKHYIKHYTEISQIRKRRYNNKKTK